MSLFGTGAARICGVAAAATAPEMKELVRAALRYTPTVELRLDWLRSDKERHAFLRWLKRERPRNAVFLATCRRRVGGGELSGDAGAELFWLTQAREAGCVWCDLEIETLRELPRQVRARFCGAAQDSPLAARFSAHAKIRGWLAASVRGGVDGVKIAAMARTISDSVRLLRLARNSRQVVTIPMGEIGLPARILALREGSALSYASVAAATAPGQVSLHELKNLYRAHELTRKTKVYGVIGNPIAHSLSPLLHNTGYIAARKAAIFLPFLVENLKDFLHAVPEFGVKGFSVTLPHKESVFRRLDECEALAEKIGAVNTVTVKSDGSLHGRNTDYIGVLKALEKRMKLRGSRVLIFGAGGSARAAAFAVTSAGAEVFVCARRDSAARALARAVGGSAIPRSLLRKEKFDAILNATPVGMHPHEGISPLAPSELNCSLVMDLIYRPLQTRLLQVAAAKGIRTVSGVEMFLAQGIAQWEHWMGRPAPSAPMRAAVLGALKAREASPR